jgi:DNA modification methylase
VSEVRILIGDMRVRLAELPDNSVDSVVCDPPYHLTSIVKRFGSESAAPAKIGQTGAYARASRGFMGQTWDGGDVAFQPETWAEIMRVLKPGGHLLSFSSTRTYHRMAVAIEDAGFEIKDCIFYCYGSGFPKSHNVNKALHGKGLVCDCGSSQVSQCDLRVVRGDDVSAAQSVHEEQDDVLLPCLPKQGLSAHRTSRPQSEPSGTEQSGVEGRGDVQAGARELQGRQVCSGAGVGAAYGADERLHYGASASDGADVRIPADADGSGEPQGSQPREQSSVEPGALADERGSQARGSWPVCGGCGKPIIPEGLGSALKPAVEPICLARKPLSEKSIAANVLKWGCGALNIDGCRIATDERPSGGTAARPNVFGPRGGAMGVGADTRSQTPEQGRWPANLCHDGSDEVVAGFPETGGPKEARTGPRGGRKIIEGGWDKSLEGYWPADEGGSAARFFKTAEYSEEEWLFQRAKAILTTWESELANTVENSSILSNPHAVFALRLAAIAALPEGRQLNALTGLSTSATPSELRRLATSFTAAILSIESGCLPEWLQGKPTPTDSHVQFAGTPRPTDTITITISHWKSSGCAEPVTFSITQQSLELGAKVSAPASRFKYCAKASSEERGSYCTHPTVKPVELMRWLVRLVTPKGGTVLDPFMGSGSTGLACQAEQFSFIGCEMSPEYAAIAERRMRDAAGLFAQIEVSDKFEAAA